MTVQRFSYSLLYDSPFYQSLRRQKGYLRAFLLGSGGLMLGLLIGILGTRIIKAGLNAAAPPPSPPPSFGVALHRDLPLTRKTEQADASPRPPEKLIIVEVSSIPAAAQVFVQGSDIALGMTPWKGVFPARPGTQFLLLRKPGYRDQPLELNSSRHSFLRAILTPIAQKPPPRPPHGAPSHGVVDPAARRRLDDNFRINPRR